MTAPTENQIRDLRVPRIALEQVYDEIYDAMVACYVDEYDIRQTVERAIEDATSPPRGVT